VNVWHLLAALLAGFGLLAAAAAIVAWKLHGHTVDPQFADAEVPSDWGEPVTEWPETVQR